MQSDIRKYRCGLLIFLIVLAGISACRNPVEDRNSWDMELLVPVFHSSMDIYDIVPDTLIETQPDSTILLVYRNTLFRFDPEKQILKVPDTSLSKTLRLDSLTIGTRTLTHKITLGQFARQLIASSDVQSQLLGHAIIGAHGNQNATIPPFSGISSGTVDIDATMFFQSAVLLHGYLDIIMFNEFPVDMENVIFVLKNKISGDIIIRDTIPLIASLDTTKKTYDIGGKTVEGTLQLKIQNVDSPGDTGVAIDTNDAFWMRFIARDISVYEATAVWPAQDLIHIKNEVRYDLGTAEITYFRIRTGQLKVFVTSTIDDEIQLHYTIPGATDNNGQPLSVTNRVPPAPPGGSVTVDETFQIDGYSVDLRGRNLNSTNTFAQELIASIDSTGQVRHISLDDSLLVSYALINIVPDYIRGYLGTDTVNFQDTVPFTLFKNFNGGTLELEDATVKFAIENGLGVDGYIRINEFRSRNKQGNRIALTSSLNHQLLSIKRGFDNPYVPVNSAWEFNSTNSNIKALIDNIPAAFEFDIDVFANPYGNVFGYQDFIYYESTFNVNIDFEMPLAFRANNIIMRDTVEFDMNIKDEDTEKLSDIIFYLIVYNGFPMDGDIQIYLYRGRNFLDSLFEVNSIQAGKLGNDCRIVSKTRNRLESIVSDERLESVKRANYAIIQARMSTNGDFPGCENEILKIYSDYQLDITLSARFKYLFDGQF